MFFYPVILFTVLCVLFSVQCDSDSASEREELAKYFSKCRRGSADFDACVLKAFNNVRPLFRKGMPGLGMAPFDPHHLNHIEQRRGGDLAKYKLVLRDVSEYGWTQSNVTKFTSDPENDRIVYSQYFPEKSLDGRYDISGNILGRRMVNRGLWNMTLYDYSQTTTVTRIGGPGGLLKVQVEIDRIGDMVLHIGNLLNGYRFIESIADTVINAAWQPGFAVIKPLINDLVSTGFTDVFNESFRHFPIDEIIS